MELITISEYARRHSISRQAAYKKVERGQLTVIEKVLPNGKTARLVWDEDNDPKNGAKTVVNPGNLVDSEVDSKVDSAVDKEASSKADFDEKSLLRTGAKQGDGEVYKVDSEVDSEVDKSGQKVDSNADRRIERLEADIAARDERIRDLEAALQSKDDRIEELTTKLTELSDRIITLSEQAMTLTNQAQQLQLAEKIPKRSFFKRLFAGREEGSV